VGRFNKLLIASSGSESHDYVRIPWGSSPSIDEQIVWADIKVRHDGAVDRTEKIIGIKNFLEENGLLLKVCLKKLGRPELNDCTCEKCFRTIMSLMLSGINPNACGFKVDNSTFRNMREYLTKPIKEATVETFYIPIQKMVPPDFQSDIPGAVEFFDWYKNFEFKSTTNLKRLRRIYHGLPYPYAKVLDMVYNKYGYYIHETTTQRT
jgi:hypothetical protein